MAKKITFDTLKYAKKLEDNGVIGSKYYAEALLDALDTNIYTTYEIDMKFEQMLNQFSLEMKNIELRLEKAINRQTYTIIGAVSAITLIISTLATVAHNFLH